MRNVVESQHGVLKRRFPILSFGMRMMLDGYCFKSYSGCCDIT
jgi:hypothetical protein